MGMSGKRVQRQHQTCRHREGLRLNENDQEISLVRANDYELFDGFCLLRYIGKYMVHKTYMNICHYQ